MPRYLLITIFLATTLVLTLGCDDRGTNITTHDITSWGISPEEDHVFVPEFSVQLRNPDEIMLMSAYIPRVAQESGLPVPLLVLLAPEGGDKYHYFKAGLFDLAHYMIETGEIEPMAIYCVGNDQTFGGYFYGNTAPAGYYDDIIGDSLVRFLTDFRLPQIIDNPSKRGIGGIGQGAYGAFRAALKHPGAFSSIAVADGPLDFDGPDGTSGLMSLFNSSLAEQEAFYLRNPKVDTTYDPVGDSNILDTMAFSYHRDFDSSRSMPVSNMFIGGALAFSPNDTLFVFERDVPAGWSTPRITVLERAQIANDLLPGGGDSTTFVGNVIRAQSETHDIDFDFHLPFDSTGQVYAPIWSRWMANNLDSLHENAGTPNPLNGVNIWIASNPTAKWNYHEMTQSWITFLQNHNYSVEEYNYSGYDDYNITDDEALYDLMREMLIFHSDNFKD